MKKRYVMKDGDGLLEVATFELSEDGKVTVTYAKPSYRKFVSFESIKGLSSRLTPADGEAYFSALDRIKQTYGWVEDVEDEDGG